MQRRAWSGPENHLEISEFRTDQQINLGTVGVGMPFTLYFTGPLTDDVIEFNGQYD